MYKTNEDAIVRSIKSIWPLIVAGLALLALCSVLLLPPPQASAQDLPTVNIVGATQSTVAEGQDAQFVFTRSGDRSASLQVRVRTHEPTHPDITIGGSNPSVTLHTVTFQPGSVSTSLHVTADLDAVAETSDSLIAVVYTVPSSTYTVGSSTEASVTITDTAPVVTIAADQTTVAEGDTATYTLTRTASTKRAL